jgi:hypothetical protein
VKVSHNHCSYDLFVHVNEVSILKMNDFHGTCRNIISIITRYPQITYKEQKDITNLCSIFDFTEM